MQLKNMADIVFAMYAAPVRKYTVVHVHSSRRRVMIISELSLGEEDMMVCWRGPKCWFIELREDDAEDVVFFDFVHCDDAVVVHAHFSHRVADGFFIGRGLRAGSSANSL
jgi:hypothetical protein